MEEDSEITEREIIEFRRCFLRYPEFIQNVRLYGPANPLRKNEFNKTSYPQCKDSEDGICYMMKCNCHSDEEITGFKDWYTGFCGVCEVKLPTKKDCWRTPDENGGFIGCYCEDHYKIMEIADEDQNIINILCKIMGAVREKYPIIYNGEGPIIYKEEDIKDDDSDFYDPF